MLHQIGSGVLGPVFRTYEPQRDRLVAVKAFKLDIVPEAVARLADALRRLAASAPSHPAIVRAIDAGLEGTSAFLAMEYASGESLDVALRHLAPSPLERALPLLLEIARGIDAAWAEGCGHGALHPRDIIVSPGTTDARVTGFGVVPALESIGAKAPVRRPYTAPERVTGAAWDIRADVYSLGVIAHELLTGRRPLGSGEQDGTLTPGIAPEQRVSVRRVLTAALAERADDRFPSAVAFVEALEAVARGEAPAHVPRPQPASKPEEVRERKRAPVDVPAVALPAADVFRPATPLPGAQPQEAPLATAGAPAPEPAGPRVWQPPQPDAMRVTPQPAQRQRGRTITSPPAAPPRDGEAADAVRKSSEPPRPALEPGLPDQPLKAPDSGLRTEAAGPRTPDAGLRTPDLELRPKSPPPARKPEHAARAPSSPVVPAASHRTLGLSPVVPGVERATPRYPWSAIAAAAIAGIVLGGVIGYRLGLSRVESVVQQITASGSSAETGTEVRVVPETAPPAVPAPRSGADARSNAAAEPSASKPSDAAARVADVKGQIVVRSVPQGALVTVDGRKLGETPVTIRDLALGTHQLLVARPGYAPHTERVTLTARSPSRTIALQLRPGVDTRAAATGTIYIDSRPRGARVLVDGRALGTTPVSIPEVAPGRHTVALELAGYRPFKTQVDVKGGEQARVTATLERTIK